jgi:uncharacterized caspase-like protein
MPLAGFFRSRFSAVSTTSTSGSDFAAGTTVRRFAQGIHQRDTVLLFAAGHGYSLNGRFYLIPQDCQGGNNPEALATGAIGQDRLQDWLAHIKAGKAIVLLDTCESGALIGGHTRARIEGAVSEAAVGRLHEATGRPVLTAAASGQFAHEGLVGSSGTTHGIFTWAILDALRNGDRNGNDLIELSELVAHVQEKVPGLAAKLKRGSRAAPVIATPNLASSRPALVREARISCSCGGCTSQDAFSFRAADYTRPRSLMV